MCREQRKKVLAAAEIDQYGIAHGASLPAAAVTSVRLNRHDAGSRFDPGGRFHLDRQPIFVTGAVDPNLIADHECCQTMQAARAI